jgi:hypothetical protein
MAESPTAQKPEQLDKMLRWLFFVALIALLPPVFTWIIGSVTDKTPGWTGLFGKGELVVGALALCADAAGGLTKTSLARKRLFAFCLCILMAIIMAGSVSLTLTDVIPVGTKQWADFAVYSFCISFVISGYAKWLTED